MKNRPLIHFIFIYLFILFICFFLKIIRFFTPVKFRTRCHNIYVSGAYLMIRTFLFIHVTNQSISYFQYNTKKEACIKTYFLFFCFVLFVCFVFSTRFRTTFTQSIKQKRFPIPRAVSTTFGWQLPTISESRL